MHRKLIFALFLLLALPVGLYLLSQKTNFFQRAFGEPANLLIDMGSSYSIPGGVWRNLAQGGEEKGRMLAPVIPQVKSLGIQYVRIDHIFDYYDTLKLDEVISDITAIGAKPFIALSYMPPAIARSGDINDLPRDWAEWETLVQKTVERISGKSGLNISGVYYEVWNEPDLFGKFKPGGDKSYLELYSHTVSAAQRAANVNPFKIGGPATTGLYKSWFDALLKIKERGVRVDFFSWHRYSRDLEDNEDDLLNIEKWLVDYPNATNLELVVSEMGINSENDKAYDGGLSAIHTLATAAVLEGRVGKAFNFEIKDGPGPEKYWGRWGILTHEKFGAPEAKPRFQALQFLNNIGGNKVNVAGSGSWVKAFAKRSGDTTKVLVVNYDKSGRHSEVVPMNFVNLPFTNFIFRRRDFSGKVTDTNISVSATSWSTVQEFSPNTAAIFELVPQ